MKKQRNSSSSSSRSGGNKLAMFLGIIFLLAVADATFLNGALLNVIQTMINGASVFTPFF